MRNLFLLLFLSCGFNSFSQSEKVEQYCQIIGMSKPFSSKVTISVDYGEESGFWKDNRLKNDDGTVKKFNSMIDALNFMGNEGWKLVNAFPITTGSQNVYHFVFKKEFEKKNPSN